MTLAFCLYKYFPFGGMQRDFLRIAAACVERGCAIRVYALSWEGPLPGDLELVTVPVAAYAHHQLYRRFSEWVEAHLREHPVDGVVGFNKMPGLDLYYAADSCYEEKARSQRGRLYRYTPRYRHFSSYEEAVFGATAHTRILLIAEQQQPLFEKYYGTPSERFHLLPPGISRDRLPPPDAARVRAELRREFAVGPEQKLLLMVGSGFVTKGLDRALHGLAALPAKECRLIVIGQDSSRTFERLARRLGVAGQMEILPGRDDIPRFLLGADLLVHPAYVENTGTILLEALIAGLPVLTTDVCGYAHFVAESGGGRVLASPFSQERFNELLGEMLLSREWSLWHRNGLEFGRTADIYRMPERAAEIICESVEKDASFK